MCISQPILSCLSQLYGGKNIILTSAVLLGVGSLISGDSETMAFLLLGRTIQGLGAGGLTVLSYVTYGHLESSTGHRYLAGMSLSMALGTICGPILGSALSRSGDWVSRACEPPTAGLTSTYVRGGCSSSIYPAVSSWAHYYTALPTPSTKQIARLPRWQAWT